METKSKAETYIGFAIKSGKCRFGGNTIETLKKANVIIVCNSAKSNTLDLAKKCAKKLNCKLLITKEKLLEELTHRTNCKVIAIQDMNLAKAIIEDKEKEFIVGE